MTDLPQHGRVVRVEQLTPRMVRVVLGGEGLASFAPTPHADQYVNCLFPPEGAPYAVPFDVDAARALEPEHRPRGRRYTVRSWDPERREVAIDFVTHGDEGVAGRWATHAQVGDLLQFTGPSGGYTPDPEADGHLLVGDESALPAIAASLEAVPAGRRAVVVVLVDDEDHELVLESPGDLTVVWVHRAGRPEADDLLLRAVTDVALPDGRVHVFVHGEAGETRAVRKHLLGDRGIAKDGSSISPYWRRTFDDEGWRRIKRDWLAEVARDV